jgi:hypothetical protein
VRFEVFMVVRMMMMMSLVLAPCRLVGRCQHFEEIHIVCIFRASALKMETVCFSETLASTDESTQHQNPEEHHHHQSKNKSTGIVVYL